MKRRLMAGMMSAMLLVGTALPVSASTDNMTVTYKQAESYTLTIPIDSQILKLSTKDNVTGTVSVTDVNLEAGREIQLSVTAGVDNNGVVELR